MVTLNAITHNGYLFSHVRQVDYYHDGTIFLSPATTPPYTLTWDNVEIGTHVLSARATLVNDQSGLVGGYAFSPPITIAVTPVADQPLVTLTAPSANSLYVTPVIIALAAIATDPAAPITKVEFYGDGTLLGTATAAPYTFTWNDVPPGVYPLTARATNSVGAATTSAPVIVWVDTGIPIGTKQRMTIALPSSCRGQ
jgi:hypothetical protein